MQNIGNKMAIKLQYINFYVIHLADDMKHWVTLVNKVINVRVFL